MAVLLPAAVGALWALPAAAFGQQGVALGLPVVGSALAGTGLMLWLLRRKPAAAPAVDPADLLQGVDGGACVFSQGLQPLAWNAQFPALADAAPDSPALRQRLEDLLARGAGRTMRFRPDGSRVADEWTTLADGGLMLTCRLMPEEPVMPSPLPMAPRPVPTIPAALAALCAEELRNRLPLLMQATALGDTAAARMEAHAMRGVAANFGLPDLAEAIGRLEGAAKAQQVPEMQRAAVPLPAMLDEALENLLGHAG